MSLYGNENVEADIANDENIYFTAAFNVKDKI